MSEVSKRRVGDGANEAIRKLDAGEKLSLRDHYYLQLFCAELDAVPYRQQRAKEDEFQRRAAFTNNTL